jgi:serine/threonine-protein kinase
MRRELLPMVRRALGDIYEVDREVARGGAARVFLARDKQGTTVALKILHPQLAVTVTAERFLREIGLLSRIEHPYIAKLLDYGESDFLVYYVMAWVEGPTLREHLNRVKQATIQDTTLIAGALLDALSYAHSQGIVHRDVKPENIVVSRNGPVLVDFGIARAIAESGTDRLTRSGAAVGTSTYMSPEQIQGIVDIDYRSDLYSLGCVIFECLTGRPPFTARREEQVLRMHLESAPPDIRVQREDLPPPLAQVIQKALAREREDRWQSAAEMRQGLAG